MEKHGRSNSNMPKRRDAEPAHRTRPIQVAKRKQKPLGHEEVEARKRSKAAKAALIEDDETSNFLDEQDEQKRFISPDKYLDKAKIGDDDKVPKEFVSPLKYVYSANEGDQSPQAKRKTNTKRQGNQESSVNCLSHTKKPGEKGSSARPLDDRLSSSQQPPQIEKPNENPSDRFVTSAQEDLLQMIDEGASDLAIENQLKIIKMLRARLPSQNRPRESNAQKQQPIKDLEQTSQTKPPHKDVVEPSRPTTPAPRNPLSISSDSDSDSDSEPSQPTPSPAPSKRRRHPFLAQAKPPREVKDLLKIARPASAPTSLPALQRPNRSLTTSDVASLSKTHATFDERETHRFDRHTRKLNGTRAMASEKPALPDRGLESRIRAPTESPEEVVGAARRRGGGECQLDAVTSGAVSAVSAAAAASSDAAVGAVGAVGGQQPLTRGKFACASQPPGKGRGNASPRALEESVRMMNAKLKARQVRDGVGAGAGAGAGAATGGQSGQSGQQPGRPGQVFDAERKRWQYVEEADSDYD